MGDGELFERPSCKPVFSGGKRYGFFLGSFLSAGKKGGEREGTNFFLHMVREKKKISSAVLKKRKGIIFFPLNAERGRKKKGHSLLLLGPFHRKDFLPKKKASRGALRAHSPGRSGHLFLKKKREETGEAGAGRKRGEGGETVLFEDPAMPSMMRRKREEKEGRALYDAPPAPGEGEKKEEKRGPAVGGLGRGGATR